MNEPNQADDEQWRGYIHILNMIMKDSLGTQLLDLNIFELIFDNHMSTWYHMRHEFIPKTLNTLTKEQKEALWQDEIYGLKDVVRYPFWDNLSIFTDNDLRKKKNLFWVWELKTYFGLSLETIDEMEANWNTWYDQETTHALEETNFIPTGEKNSTNFAYW